MSFGVPDFAIGDGRRFRVSASQVASRDSFFTCPIGLALRARQAAQSLQPNDQSRWRRQWDDATGLHFALRDCYHSVARGGDSITDALARESNLTHAQRRFLHHALGLLQDLADVASEAAGVQYEVGDEEFRTETHVGDLEGEVTLFARHLRTRDGAVHEAVRMRLKQLRPSREGDLDWTAVAALTLGYSPGVEPNARLRISEFSLADGELRCVFDGSRTDAAARHAERGRPVRAAIDGTVFRPGSSCSDCGFLNVCPAVPQRRGVLGIPGRAVATRSLTAADLSAYDRCPTAFAAQRRDHLPDGYAETADADAGRAARDRGLAVHSWLRAAHSRTPPQACTHDDLPSPDDSAVTGVAAEAGLDPDFYRIAYPYLVQHIEHCTLGFDGLGGWTTERRVVVYDADADLVVISTPDLTGEIAGTGDPIWRETKTARMIPPDIEAAMYLYPGFALNVALLAADAPARLNTGHAELEILTPVDSTVFAVSLDEGATVAFAQRLVADIARKYAADLTFDRKPSGACFNCPSHRWCDPPTHAFAGAGPAPEVDDAEFADFDVPF